MGTSSSFTAKQQAIRHDLAAAGAQRLVAESMNRLLASVAPAALAEACDVSPDTVQRLVGGRAEMLVHVTETAVTSLEFSAPGWPTFSEITDGAAEVFLLGIGDASGPAKTAAFIDALEVYIAANLSTPARPAEGIIDAAVMTVSPKWEGPQYLDGEVRQVAEQLRLARARLLAEQTEGFGWLLAEAMAQLQRRPQRGTSVETMIVLMNCLVDGAVMRMLIDPDSLTVDVIADAVFRLGMAFTETGSFEDPHEPDDPDSRQTFATILDAATALWGTTEDVTLADVAAELPGIDEDTVQRWFTSVRELADSVVRRRVSSVQPEPSDHPDAQIAILESVLHRLCLTADEVPGAVRSAFVADPPPGSIAAQLTEHALAVIEGLDQPGFLAEQLIADACEGSGRWTRTQTLLKLLDPTSRR
jgi:hypothetical protein